MNAAVNRHTPSITANDSRGLPTRQIAYLRTTADDLPQALMTPQQCDVAGRLVAQWDARLSTPVTTSVYGLGSEPLKVDNVDAGWRLSLPGLAGQVTRRWADRAGSWTLTHDDRLRVVAIENSAEPTASERFVYADGTGDAGHNLRGQLLDQSDESGSLHFPGYSLGGHPLYETRTFHDAKTFTSHSRFSPLGAVLEWTDAGQHRQQSRYDIAGQLTQRQLQISGQTVWQPLLTAAGYNADGQIIEQRTANGVVNRWHYDAANGRLHRQTTQIAQAPMLQDLEYVYDPVGNITLIYDHVFTPSYFANQRVDGHRRFTYDSLYRLHTASGYDDAPPADNAGRPLQPTNPNDRRNYTQTYTYDLGNNLIKTSHVRDGANHTYRMLIDPNSNRGVRWNEGDPPPDFDALFDRHGNLLALHPGQPMRWSSRDQLAEVTVVHRDSGPDDREHYRYSQGTRIYKRHDFYNASNSHFHEVRYQPGLEIRTKDTGETLHLINVATAAGTARCLHWAANPPSGIDPDQVRYGVNDHLSSCVMEFDHNARMATHEGYYPFGGTAWIVARALIEVAYKFVRYSNKEMDVSGLYDYGLRYYAPWLQRWVSADPAGDVDGPNLYAFVGNNPLRYVDPQGSAKAESVIMLYSNFIGILGGFSSQTLGQMDTITRQKGIKSSLFLNMAGEVSGGIMGYEAGNLGGGQVGLLIPDVPHVANNTHISRLPYIEAAIGGNAGGDIAGAVSAPVTSLGLIKSLIPKTSTMSVAAIDSELGIPDSVNELELNWRSIRDELINPALNKIFNPEFVTNRGIGAWISILPGAINLFQRAVEAEDIKNRLDPAKIGKIESMLASWETALNERSAAVEDAFTAWGADVLNPADVLPNVNHMTPSETLAPITRQGVRLRTAVIRDDIRRIRGAIAAYKDAGTTDNLFLARQRNDNAYPGLLKNASQRLVGKLNKVVWDAHYAKRSAFQ